MEIIKNTYVDKMYWTEQVAALAVNANTATLLDSISASFDTLESERRQIEAVLTLL